MRKAAKLVLLSVFFLLCSVGPSLSMDTDLNRVYIPEEVEYLTLLDHSAGVLDVSGRYSEDFRPVEGGIVRFWDFRESLWVRIPMARLLELSSAFPESGAALMLEDEYIADVDCFLPDASGGFRQLNHGPNENIERRNFPSLYPVFRLKDISDRGFAYIRVRTNLPVAFAFSVRNVDSFYSLFTDRLTRNMLFYSFMLALTFTCFLFYLMTGDRSYLHVVLRQLAALVFLFALSGYLQYYFNISSRVVQVLMWCAIGVHCVGTSFFCRHLMQMDEGPWGRPAICLQVSLSIAMAICALGGYTFLTLFPVLAALAVEILSFMTVGIVRYRQGYRMILLFIFSRVAFIAGLVYLGLDMLFFCHTNMCENIYMICFLLDPILLICMLMPATRQRLENYFSLEEKSTHFEELSQRDGMTGLYNKAHLLSILDTQIRAAQSANKVLAFMMLDLDHFKKFNDTWGHPEGDRVLNFLAKIIRQCLRESDIAARYGGEEFSIILPGGTLPTSILVAERIRRTFETQSSGLGENRTTTVSIGISFLEPGDTVTSLIKRADDALYRAKANGRNRTEFEVIS